MTKQSDHHGLPTPRSTLRDSTATVLVWCKACRHQAEADLQKLVDEGRGDVPLIHLRYRCKQVPQHLRGAILSPLCHDRRGPGPIGLHT